MNHRPVLKPGDVCRVSNKHKHRGNRKSVYVVLKVLSGDGSDRFSTIQVVESIPSHFSKTGFLRPIKRIITRDYLWFTGYNINSKKLQKVKNISIPNIDIQQRGPHLCNCNDLHLIRHGCTCNGL